MNKKLRVYMTATCSEALGPYRRFVIWTQGCNRRCEGCIAKDSWELDGGDIIEIDDLVHQILLQHTIEGITISGGEPFLQQEALCELIVKVREHKNIGVIIYTGLRYDEIATTMLTRLSDIIIDGEYVEELNDDKSLRGSSNQNVICLTDRYKDIIPLYYGVQGRKIELLLLGGATKMIGIPSKEFKQMIGE